MEIEPPNRAKRHVFDGRDRAVPSHKTMLRGYVVVAVECRSITLMIHRTPMGFACASLSGKDKKQISPGGA